MKTTLTRSELSSIQRSLYEMITTSGKMEDPNYESLAESLDTLNFKDFSLEDFALHLKDAIEEMYQLSNPRFEYGQLDHYMNRLQ